MPCEIAAYIAIHTFGIRMIYPGSIRLLQSFLHPVLVQGRAKLVEEEHAKRYKLKTVDGNDIDTIFIDHRADAIEKDNNGKTLVICSEGNAGFYEIGIMTTPIAMKYSVLGWNHPGFGGSTVKTNAQNHTTLNRLNCFYSLLFRAHLIHNKINMQSMLLCSLPFICSDFSPRIFCYLVGASAAIRPW